MNSKTKLYHKMAEKLETFHPRTWKEIDAVLEDIKREHQKTYHEHKTPFFKEINQGIAFITYDYGIDGVSIEIAKYAKSLQNFLFKNTVPNIHFIGGDFYPPADTILKKEWKRFRLEGSNGWGKWENAYWYNQLFHQDMPTWGQKSNELAQEIWKQAVHLSKRLGKYLVDNTIHLLIPVNVCSNPGNLALGLCIPLVTELMKIYVLNSNHDYYWEGGKPANEKEPEEIPGPRDHFFKNYNNRDFFRLFEKLYPWDGSRWIQTNINKLQSERLIETYHFNPNDVFELATSISDEFFIHYLWGNVQSVRLRMAYILSDGKPIIRSIAVKNHLKDLKNWMLHQKPVVCTFSEDLKLDPTTKDTIYLLQPTRIIARKRIEKDIQLIESLLEYPKFRKVFDENLNKQIVLHITGPVPIEHQSDLETILKAFYSTCKRFPKSVTDRLFLSFSVGREEHPVFREKDLERLHIHDIYQLATAVVFPSQTEGRGLPIVEASAGGIPIICSRYLPFEVFDGIIGSTLKEEEQIRYTLFPEGEFSEKFLDKITELLLFPEKNRKTNKHNQKVVKKRYSEAVMNANLRNILTKFAETH